MLLKVDMTFENNDADLSIVQPKLQLTLSTLQQLKDRPGLNTRKVTKFLESLDISEQEVKSLSKTESSFIDNLVTNITNRFQSSDIVNAMSILCNPSTTATVCGSEDLEILAEH